jgi:hypothetical protein
MKHRVQLTLLTGALAMFLAACSAESERNEPVATTTASGTPSTAAPAAEVKKRDRALLRVINAIPGLGAADVKDDQGNVITVVNYKQITPYKELHSEVQTLRLLPKGQLNARPLATNNELLRAGGHYTAIALPDQNGKAVLRVVKDNLTPPMANQVKVRVINAANDAGEIDVYAQGNNKALFKGVNFQTVTSYDEVVAKTATLEVRSEGQPKALLTVPNVNFAPLKIYTIVVTGKAKGTPKLEAMVVEDELVGAPPSTPQPTPNFVK